MKGEPEIRGTTAFFHVDQPILVVLGTFHLMPEVEAIETPHAVWLRSDVKDLEKLSRRASNRSGTPEPAYLKKVIGDTIYTFTPALCEGAINYFERLPYDNNPYDEEEDEDRHREWEDGNALASSDEVKEPFVRKALGHARKAEESVGPPAAARPKKRTPKKAR